MSHFNSTRNGSSPQDHATDKSPPLTPPSCPSPPADKSNGGHGSGQPGASSPQQSAGASSLAPVIVITGCTTGGIGHALVKAFSTMGCRVFATVRRADAAVDLVSLDDPNVTVVIMEITDRESVKRAITAIVQRVGKIDMLINNAGVSFSGPVVEVDVNGMRDTFETNVFGLVNTIQEVVPHMASRQTGRIVNIGSMVGFIPIPWTGVYCASKAAVHAITSALRMELHPFGIDVILVAAGAVKTNISLNTSKRMEQFNQGFPASPRGGSLYGILKEQINKRPSTHSNGSDPALFAIRLAGRLLRKKVPSTIWIGQMSWIFWFLTLLPTWIMEIFITWRFGLGKKMEKVKRQ
ncbi:putative short-chain dehydrogenase [Polychytrium aggregatum]|uniref:putative short-chain dehydrogenase n=1 Tax=Polychytrium aggregatum TaxID=110093 RepID=UPI0022FE0E08|nr:putative short-chain dehydrogenase [Polychytrium aggregatum]KAI9207295.1 putative short-chain dehydrogenase [Polychytrium aggregatum]